MARDVTHAGLTVDAIRAEDQGLWLFAVNVEGAQVVIGSRKLGGVDDDIARARDQAAQDALAAEQASAAPSTGA